MSDGRKNVLVIEPDPRVRTIFCDLLRRRNVRVRMGATLAEALKQVRKRRFECLIIDADTEGEKGTDALERLRLVAPNLKVLLVSRRPRKAPQEASDDRTFLCYLDAARFADTSRS
jgi:DNA-binding NtrC family response regulator